MCWDNKRAIPRAETCERSVAGESRAYTYTAFGTTLLFPTEEHTPNRHLEERINKLAIKAGVTIGKKLV